MKMMVMVVMVVAMLVSDGDNYGDGGGDDECDNDLDDDDEYVGDGGDDGNNDSDGQIPVGNNMHWALALFCSWLFRCNNFASSHQHRKVITVSILILHVNWGRGSELKNMVLKPAVSTTSRPSWTLCLFLLERNGWGWYLW